MARLIRCIEGHMFEEDKGPLCPECGASTSFLAAEARAAPSERAAVQRPTSSNVSRKPLALAAAGGAVLALIVVGILLRSERTSAPVSDPKPAVASAEPKQTDPPAVKPAEVASDPKPAAVPPTSKPADV